MRVNLEEAADDDTWTRYLNTRCLMSSWEMIIQKDTRRLNEASCR